MIAKALQSLKKNPVLIVYYVVYLAVVFLMTYSMYPKDFGANTDPMAAMAAMGKVMLVSVLMGVLGILFFSGYGKMVADAVIGAGTSASAFVEGLKKFFVRVLLAALLLVAFYIGFVIVLGIIMIPFTIMFAMGNTADPTAAGTMMGIVSSIVVGVLVIFVVPFIILWYPAIFIDDVGVMEGLKRGAKAGVKSYWALVLGLLVMYLPSLVYTVSNISNLANASKANIFTPGYMVMSIVMSAVSLIFIPFIFVAYNEKKPVPVQTEDEF